ncbi:DivIVA domain-containing protein [Micromonospora sp. NBRC 101691]|uniref:DivIVA domain-containing protein n=1 Tax=Micromonospora sp. NBRC 101691 TaxID=3032198 RepID=UPI0024A276D6|nr:hypothetical protein Misp04_60520 [Micromonospora sp. NBRC 101691]
MRTILRRLLGRHHRRRPAYRHPVNAAPPSAYRPLRPWQVRARCFTTRRHGLDPDEIRAFLHRVADELTVAQTALEAVLDENKRIKDALRDWQTGHALRATAGDRR